jgi:hypothetical protein
MVELNETLQISKKIVTYSYPSLAAMEIKSDSVPTSKGSRPHEHGVGALLYTSQMDNITVR